MSLIQSSQYIRPKVTVHKCVGIRMRVLFKGGSNMRKYGNLQIEPHPNRCHKPINDLP